MQFPIAVGLTNTNLSVDKCKEIHLLEIHKAPIAFKIRKTFIVNKEF